MHRSMYLQRLTLEATGTSIFELIIEPTRPTDGAIDVSPQFRLKFLA